MTVSPSGTTEGPSVPESDGGAPMPVGAGGPPVVRNRARVVSACIRSVSSPRPSAVALNETTVVAGCGSGRIPAWYRPWNGTAGSRPVAAWSAATWVLGVGWDAR